MVFEHALRILGPAQAETAGTYQHPAFQASLRCSCVLAESFSFQIPDYAVSGGDSSQKHCASSFLSDRARAWEGSKRFFLRVPI